MRILLLNPYWPYPYSKGESTYNRIWPPLCLANCAAILEKKGYNVTILDAHARRVKPEKIINYIKGYDKIFITSSTLDKWQCPNVDIAPFLETVQYIRTLTDEFYVMGYHGTAEPETILDLTKAKAVIRGEPEDTVAEICRNSDLYKITGITFRSNGRLISNSDRSPIDIKTLPIPAYHLLDINKYFYEILGRNFVLFEISRGCNYQCKFCNKIMYGKGVREKSIEQIIEEIKTAIERDNVKTGYFIDLEFIFDNKIVNQLCDFLIKKKYNFKWCCQTRPDSLDIEILKKMKKSGCTLIHLGIESGLQKFLDYLDKKITLEKIKKAVKLCNQVGIKTLAFFLFSFPEESKKDREEVFKFIKEINVNFISLHKLFPYKGSDIYNLRSYLVNGIYQTKFDRNDIDSFIRKSYIKYYLKPPCLFRLNLSVILSGIRLFWGRIKTL